MKVRTRQVPITGEDHPAYVTTSIRAGLPSFTVMGLSDLRSRELLTDVRDRVDVPHERVTVRVAPLRLLSLLDDETLVDTVALTLQELTS